MRDVGLMIMLIGALLLLLGGGLWVAGKFNLPVGRLPGDLQVQGKNWTFSFPIVTCILLSIVLTLLLNFFFRR